MGSPYLFTCQCGLLKWGIFAELRVKSSNHLHPDLSLGYPKDTKFYLESEVSLIDNYAVLLHLSCFWSLGCENIALFRTVPWLAWSPGLSQNTSSRGLFSWKKYVLLSNFFSSSSTFFIRLFLANTLKKLGGHRARLREKKNLFRYRG